jgi:hypothetical protein
MGVRLLAHFAHRALDAVGWNLGISAHNPLWDGRVASLTWLFTDVRLFGASGIDGGLS